MATLAQAIRLALHHAETELGVAEILGQDVGPPLGGVFTLTQGIDRAWNSPLDERGIVGTAAGLAMMGVRSICEIQFGDYLLNTVDLLRLIGNTCWSTRGQFPMPMVLLTPVGAGIHGGIYHSHSVESLLSRLSGWKVVMPSTSADAFGLLLSAVEDGNPVAYLVPKALLYRSCGSLPSEPSDLSRRINAPPEGRERWRPDWPPIPPQRVPIGPARHVRAGDSLTIATWGRMVSVTESALEGIEGVDLLDLRTLVPFDRGALLDSARRTRRLLVINEDSEQTNFGEHLLRVAIEASPGVRLRLIAARHLPGIGLAQALEDYVVPTADRIRREVEAMLASG